MSRELTEGSSSCIGASGLDILFVIGISSFVILSRFVLRTFALSHEGFPLINRGYWTAADRISHRLADDSIPANRARICRAFRGSKPTARNPPCLREVFSVPPRRRSGARHAFAPGPALKPQVGWAVRS